MTTETGSQDMSEILLLDEDNKQELEAPPLATRKSRRRVVDDDSSVDEAADQSGPTQVTQLGPVHSSPDPEEHSVHAENTREVTENSSKSTAIIPAPTVTTTSDCQPHTSTPNLVPSSVDTQLYLDDVKDMAQHVGGNFATALECGDDSDHASGSELEWNIEQTHPGGAKETIGDCTLFPKLETTGGHVVFQGGDSIRRGKSEMTILGVIQVDDEVKLLCIGSRKGSLAKTVPVRHYQKICSPGPSPACQAALVQWIRAKSLEHQELARTRKKTKFFEETAVVKPVKVRAPGKRKSTQVESHHLPPKKKLRSCGSNTLPTSPREEVAVNARFHDPPPSQVLATNTAVQNSLVPALPLPGTSLLSGTDLYLRLCLTENQLQKMRQQMLTEELHAMEEHRLARLIAQQRTDELQNELTLLKAVYFARQKK